MSLDGGDDLSRGRRFRDMLVFQADTDDGTSLGIGRCVFQLGADLLRTLRHQGNADIRRERPTVSDPVIVYGDLNDAGLGRADLHADGHPLRMLSGIDDRF